MYTDFELEVMAGCRELGPYDYQEAMELLDKIEASDIKPSEAKTQRFFEALWRWFEDYGHAGAWNGKGWWVRERLQLRCTWVELQDGNLIPDYYYLRFI